MRRVALRVAQPITREGERLDVFGPLADLSGVDDSEPRASVPASPIPPAACGLSGRLVGPPCVASPPARADDAAFVRQAWTSRVASVSVSVGRSVEHGVVPLGVRAVDAFGNASDIAETSVLIIDRPRRAADLAIARSAGLVRLTIEEWPDG
jgi:hypothetical protein